MNEDTRPLPERLRSLLTREQAWRLVRFKTTWCARRLVELGYCPDERAARHQMFLRWMRQTGRLAS